VELVGVARMRPRLFPNPLDRVSVQRTQLSRALAAAARLHGVAAPFF
jgi:hypothetical protein